MCGRALTAFVPPIEQQDAEDTIPAGMRVIAVGKPHPVAKGAARAELVAAHLRVANLKLTGMWEQVAYNGDDATPYQAGAASTWAFADLLEALIDGNVDLAKSVIEQFVNNAVDTGAVTA